MTVPKGLRKELKLRFQAYEAHQTVLRAGLECFAKGLLNNDSGLDPIVSQLCVAEMKKIICEENDSYQKIMSAIVGLAASMESDSEDSVLPFA